MRRYCGSVVVASLLCTLPLSLAAASDQETIHSGYQEQGLSRLYVVPLRIEARDPDRSSDCVALTAEQLQIRLRGESIDPNDKRGLVTLDRRARPTLHAFVFDTSGSMSRDLEDARRAARAYLSQLDPAIDVGMVVSFDDGVTLWQGVTGRQDELARAMDRLIVGGQTSLFDAVVATIRELDTRRERPVLILLSDGADNASFYDNRDLADELRKRPDIALFTISIGKRASATRQLLAGLARRTHGKYFEVERGEELEGVFSAISETLGTEALLTVADPKPGALPATLEVSAKGRCRVTQLGSWRDVEERKAANEPVPFRSIALPYQFRSPVSSAHEKILVEGELEVELNRCIDRTQPLTEQPRRWSFEVREDRTLGCGPDITLEHGYLYNPSASLMVERNPQVRFKLRPFEILTPTPNSLPRQPGAIVDHLLEQLPNDPAGSEFDLLARDEHSKRLFGIAEVVDGMTFLEMRPHIARALFMQPEYQSWALGRLARQAEQDLKQLRERYRLRFPDASEEALTIAMEHSDEVLAIRTRAANPSEIDLQPFLAAWHGDLEAQSLFEGWERRQLRRLLEGDVALQRADFLQRWNRLRRIFAAPSVTRVIAPLVPIYDAECDCVGFYRVVMPRPSLLRARLSERTPFQSPIPLDLPAKYPFGYAVLKELFLRSPEIQAEMLDRGYRIAALRYELLGAASGHDPRHAFRETRVQIDFVADSETRKNLRLQAEVSVAILPDNAKQPLRARWILDRLSFESELDHELNRFGKRIAAELEGVELLGERFEKISQRGSQ